jgi:hypothetical protein
MITAGISISAQFENPNVCHIRPLEIHTAQYGQMGCLDFAKNYTAIDCSG